MFQIKSKTREQFNFKTTLKNSIFETFTSRFGFHRFSLIYTSYLLNSFNNDGTKNSCCRSNSKKIYILISLDALVKTIFVTDFFFCINAERILQKAFFKKKL